MNALTSPPQSPAITTSVVIDWQLSSYFAWGLVGINFLLNWTLQHPEPMLAAMPIDEKLIDLNPLEWNCIGAAVNGSRNLQARLEPLRGKHVKLNVPVFKALGNELADAGLLADVARISGTPTIGAAVFESTALTPEICERAKAYDLLIVPSKWNRHVLETAGIGPIAVVHEGIDPTVFHPAPRAGLFRDRFTVFSGGKLEYRKGQDLILRAFAIFARRHPDALLVTTWNSPWPKLAQTLNAEPALEPIEFLADGRPDTVRWAVANGIQPDQYIAIGTLPNKQLPRIYREMDVAIFANRCEGATNLVAMECMACGVPVIISDNTGHRDVIAPERCIVLEEQVPIGGDDRAGWAQSSIEEMVAALESAYADRPANAARGARGAAFMQDRTWARYTRLRAAAVAAYV